MAAAARLFRQQGYHGTALQDILAAAGSPRGSLYFHFPKGKEEIGAAALSIAGEAARQAIAHAAETSESAEMFVIRVARGMASDLEKSGFKEGCPIATTALETSAQSDVLGAATRNAFQKWELEIKRGLFRFGTFCIEASRGLRTSAGFATGPSTSRTIALFSARLCIG